MLARFAGSRVVATAGVYRQLDVLHDELARVMHRLDGWKLTEHELEHPSGCKFLWYSADHPGLFEGQHAKHMALLIDEAKSVPRDIAAASERLQATRTLVMSSAGGAVGWFYDCFTSKRAHWNVAQVAANQCARISRDWVEEMRSMHGESSPLFRSAVLAEFSQSDEGAFISLEAVQRCIRQPPGPAGREIVAGVDLSASDSGDESVIVVRRGNAVASIVAFRDSDAMRVAGRCIMALTDQRIPRGCVFADAGGLGVGIVDRMRELGWPVNGVHFGGSPMSADPRFGNRMTELWCRMKEEIEACRIALPNDDALIAQLTGRRAVVQSSGKIKLESKAEMKRRGLPSPDRADALALALLSPSAGRIRRTIPDSEVKWETIGMGRMGGGDDGEGPKYATTYGGTDLGGF